MFASTVEVALAVPREFPGHKLLRARFISFVHRMVEGLQVRVGGRGGAHRCQPTRRGCWLARPIHAAAAPWHAAAPLPPARH